MEYDARPNRPADPREGRRTWVLRGLALALTLSVAGPALSAEEPLSGPSLAPVDESLIPLLPDFPVLWQAPPVALELSFAQPFGPQDKGGTYTDMGVGLPGQLTARESALLDLARAAVEASRAAGTLEVAPLGSQPAGDPADLERWKRESMSAPNAVTPTPGTGAPTEFIGDGSGRATAPAASLSAATSSSVPMTAAELAKLTAARDGSGVVVLPAPPAVVEPAGAPKRPVTEGK